MMIAGPLACVERLIAVGAHAVEQIAMLSFRKSTILSPRLALGGARTMASAGVMPRQATRRATLPCPIGPRNLENLGSSKFARRSPAILRPPDRGIAPRRNPRNGR